MLESRTIFCGSVVLFCNPKIHGCFASILPTGESPHIVIGCRSSGAPWMQHHENQGVISVGESNAAGCVRHAFDMFWLSDLFLQPNWRRTKNRIRANRIFMTPGCSECRAKSDGVFSRRQPQKQSRQTRQPGDPGRQLWLTTAAVLSIEFVRRLLKTFFPYRP